MTTLRQSLKALLQAHAAQGISTDAIVLHYPGVERRRIVKTLENMQMADEAHKVPGARRFTGTWFAGQRQDATLLTSTQRKQIARARYLDRVQPLVPFGACLAYGTCTSVWDFANKFQAEQTCHLHPSN